MFLILRTAWTWCDYQDRMLKLRDVLSSLQVLPKPAPRRRLIYNVEEDRHFLQSLLRRLMILFFYFYSSILLLLLKFVFDFLVKFYVSADYGSISVNFFKFI